MENSNKTSNRTVLSFLESAAALVVWEGTYSASIQYVLISVSNIQIIALLYQSRMKFLVAPNRIAGILSVALNLTTWQQLWTDSAEEQTPLITTNLVFIWVYLLVPLLTIIWAIRKYFILKQSLSKPHKLLTIFSQLHLAFGFCILSAILSNTLEDITSNSEPSSWLAYTVTLVLILLNLLFGLCLALYSYDPFGNSNLLSCHSPSFQVFSFIIKAILTLMTISGEESDFGYWLATILSAVFLVFRHFDLLINFPFYEYKAMKVALALSSICLGVSFFNVVLIFIKDQYEVSADNLMGIEIIFIILFIKVWQGIFQTITLKSLEQSNGSIISSTKALRKLLSIKHFLKDAKLSVNELKLSSTDELLFWSLVTLPTSQQSDSQKENNMLSLDQNKTENIDNAPKFGMNNVRSDCHEYTRNHVRNFLKEIVERLKHSNKLRALLLLDSIDDPKYAITSTFYLMALLKAHDFRTRVVALKLQGKLQQNLSSFYHEQKKNELDSLTFVNFENTSTDLIRMIYSNIQTHISFWKLYGTSDIQVKKLSEISKTFEINHEKTHAYWTRKIESNTIFSSALAHIYSPYLALICNRPASAAKILRRVTFLNSHHQKLSLSPQHLNNHSTILLNISMAKENPGSILYVSPHIQEVLGWSSRELIGRGISQLIPLFARERHEQIVKRHLRQIMDMTTTNVLEHPQDTFVLSEKGYILPCRIDISLCPDIKDGLVYAAIMRVDECKKKDYILLRQDNYILGLTQNLGSELKLSASKNVSIQEICQNFTQLKQAIAKHNYHDDYDNLERKSEFLTDMGSENAQFQGNLELCFKQQGSSKNLVFYDAQLSKQTLCQIPVNILCLLENTEEKNQIDWRSPLLPEKILINQSPRSNVSSNRVLEDHLIEAAKVLPSFELVSPRPESSKKLLDPIYSFPIEGLHPTETSQRNKLLPTSLQSDPDLKPPSRNLKKQEDKVKQSPELEERARFKTEEEMSTLSGKDFSAKIERALHSVPKDPKLKSLKLVGILLLVASIASLCGWEAKNNVTLGRVSGNIDVLSQTKTMLSGILKLNRLIRFVALDDLGLLNSQRYLPYAVVTNFKAQVAPPIVTYAKNINTLKNNIKEALNRIDPAQQSAIYDVKYNLSSPDMIDNVNMVHETNIFDFVTEIVSEGIKFGSSPMSSLNSQNPSLHFILNNTLNDLLLGGENIIPVLLEDSNKKLERQSTLVVAVFSILLGMSFIIMALAYNVIKSFIQSRNRFWDVFSFLESAPIQEQITQASKFACYIERSNFMSRSQYLDREKLQLKPHKIKSGSKIIKRILNKKGINGFLLTHCFGITLFVIIVLIIYLAIFLMSTDQTNTIIRNLNLLATSDNYLYELMLLYSMQYAYIQYNKTTTVRGNPIVEQWNRTFNDFTLSQDFYLTTLLDDKQGIGMDETLVNYVKGDLCSLINTPYKSVCVMLKGEPLKAGIVGMNSFFLAAFQEIISSFNACNGTFEALSGILNAPNIAMEDVTAYYFADGAYKLITDYIRAKLQGNVDTFEKNFMIAVLLYCLFSTVVLYAWWKICKSFEEEMVYWERIIRQIPWDILVNNKFLKKMLSMR